MHISKSLRIQTGYVMSHCLILIYINYTAVHRDSVVTVRCSVCVLAKFLLEMTSNRCCTWKTLRERPPCKLQFLRSAKERDIQEKESPNNRHNSLSWYKSHKGLQQHSCTISFIEGLCFEQR